MTTTQSPIISLSDAAYDETDTFVSQNSPLMKQLHPKLELSPSPQPELSEPLVSFSPPASGTIPRSNRKKVHPSPGDAVLVAYLDNNRHPEISSTAGVEVLPDDDEDDDNEFDDGYSTANDSLEGQGIKDDSQYKSSLEIKSHNHVAPPNLQNIATGALHMVSSDPVSPTTLPRLTAEISASTRQLSIHDDVPVLGPPRTNPPGREVRYAPDTEANNHHRLPQSPFAVGGISGELPPLLMDSPKADFSSHNLPSISSTLGDIKSLRTEPPTESDRSPHRMHGGAFPRSPPGGIPRLHPVAGTPHVSPPSPLSPQEASHRRFGSPHSLPSAASHHHYFAGNGPVPHRSSVDYSSSGTGETPSTDQSASTPATSAASVADPMSIDGITNPVGSYVCNEPGCTAPPFQTPYLLNSHANVHSSERPHYCPVPGCTRGQGGKGFKRKNEMIRHGLVHDSPGYVCPFCPDREHKYPRPDNLQR